MKVPGLLPRTVDCEGFALQSLDDEVGHNSAIIGMHPIIIIIVIVIIITIIIIY